MLFTSIEKQLGHGLKIEVNGKRLYEPDSTKYLGIHIDESLTWKQQIIHVAAKLIKVNFMLSKSRQVLDIKTLRPVSNAIFESNICYASVVRVKKTLIQ